MNPYLLNMGIWSVMKATGILCFMCLILMCETSGAQDVNLDSLRQLIEQAPDVDKRLTAISDVVKYTLYNQQDTADHYARRFLDCAKTHQIETEIARGYNLIGLVAYVRGDQVEAMENYLESLRRFELLGDLQMQGILQNNIAGLYLNRGDVDKTISFFSSAYQTFEQLGDEEWMSHVKFNLANQYFKKTNTH